MWCGKHRLSVLVLGWSCAVAAGFLLDNVDYSHDETLSMAFEAIRQLNGKLDQLQAENHQLSGKLDAVTADNDHLRTQLASHAQTISQVQANVTGMGSRVSRDFVWFDDWILAFRATARIGQPVYDAWTHVGHHDDDPMTRDTLPCGCVTINGSLPCDRHYRSRLLDTWPSASIDQVRLVLYENGVEKEHVTFTGTGSDYMNWFSHSRVMESSWTDLKSTTGLNFFSIAGDTTWKRRFFISHLYNVCPGDMGWLVVKDSATDICDWATVQHPPGFLYSPSNHDITWDGHGFRQADVMAVFVKLRPQTKLNEVCLN